MLYPTSYLLSPPFLCLQDRISSTTYSCFDLYYSSSTLKRGLKYLKMLPNPYFHINIKSIKTVTGIIVLNFSILVNKKQILPSMAGKQSHRNNFGKASLMGVGGQWFEVN